MKKPEFKLWIFSAFIALLFILKNGYFFNCYDQEEHLPQVYKLLDPALYPHDYFVTQWENMFTVREFYVRLVYFVSLLIPVSAAVFFLYFLCLAVSAYFSLQISFHYQNNLPASLISVFLIFIAFNEWTVGGNDFQAIQFISSSVGMVFCLSSLLCFIRKKFAVAFILAGAAGLFQLILGLQQAIILSVLFLFSSETRKPIRIVFYGLLFLVSVSPVLVPAIINQLSAAHVDMDAYYEILYSFRNPHHYIPSAFPLTDYIKSSALAAAGIACLLFVQSPMRRTFFIITLTVIAGAAGYTLFLEVLGINFIGVIQWFKATIWLAFIGTVVLSHYVFEKIIRKTWNAGWEKRIFIASAICLLPMALLLFNSTWFPDKRLKSRYKIGNYVKNDLTLMHEWIEKNIDVSAIILTSPVDESFLCEAKRSMPVGYKAVIHSPEFMVDWYNRFKAFYGVKIGECNPQSAQQRARINYNTTFIDPSSLPYRVDFRLDNLDESLIAKKLKIIHTEGKWAFSEYTNK